MDTPIYNALTLEFQRAGRSLPWIISFKPKGTVSILPETSTGIHWFPADRYLRDWRIDAWYGSMVCNGKDNCSVCSLFINPM